MKLKFKLDPKDRLYIGEVYITNGHWAFKRDALNHYSKGSQTLKLLRPLLTMKVGRYELGEYLTDSLPDLSVPFKVDVSTYSPGVISEAAELHPVLLTLERVILVGADPLITVGVAPHYAPLLSAFGGDFMLRGGSDPILIRDGAKEVVGVLMPKRGKEKV